MKKSAFFAVFFLLAASVTFAWAAEAEVPENADAAVVSEPAAESVENAEAQEPVKKSLWEKAGDWKKAAAEKAGEVKETIAEKTGEVKEATAEKAGAVKETVSEKAGVVKETVSEKAGVVKETVTEKAGAVKKTVVEKTKQIGGKYKSGKDWFEKKKQEYKSVKNWCKAKKEHWKDFCERKYLKQPNPKMVVYSWVFALTSVISWLLAGVGYLVSSKRGEKTIALKKVFKHILFFLFICFTLGFAAFYYVCTCETDLSWLVCFVGVIIFWILYAYLFRNNESCSGPVNFMGRLSRFSSDCAFDIPDDSPISQILMGIFIILAVVFSIIAMHIIWLIYVCGCINYFKTSYFGQPLQDGNEFALQEGIEEKP